MSIRPAGNLTTAAIPPVEGRAGLPASFPFRNGSSSPSRILPVEGIFVRPVESYRPLEDYRNVYRRQATTSLRV